MTALGNMTLKNTPATEPMRTTGNITFVTLYSMHVASFIGCLALYVNANLEIEPLRMVNPLTAIAALVSNLKNTIRRGTIIPPPPIPDMTASAIKIVRTTVPPISIGYIGKIDL